MATQAWKSPLLGVLALAALAGVAPFRALAQNPPSVSTTELAATIATKIHSVPEFRFIQEEAKKLGVRAWLFGGTAAGFGHYVKWDRLREKGDARYQGDRFDYDYSNIYRSTQDLDIVIDGTPEEAAQLQAALAERYPHLQGSKSVWEVRLLRGKVGDKLALLDNPDFLNQHTDSNSTGLIELTPPKPGEPVVRDLLDWKSAEPPFLQDLSEGRLHYHYSDRHETTSRAKAGMNPPILSVIRYLTKAFQYELALRPEDEGKIRQIIDAFDPSSLSKKDASYARDWLEKNGKKLIMHAVNIEYAWATLHRLGLRRKLIALRRDPERTDSLAWWLSREPLRTYALGTTGLTARELGLTVVGHETKDYLAYESITRAHTGSPNVLISRDDAVGEVALYGDGFYAAVGKDGARGTGFTIRFAVNPEARLGIDFVLADDPRQGGKVSLGQFVIFKNKAALRVIPESLNFTPLEYFRVLIENREDFSKNLGVLQKFQRRIHNATRALSEAESGEIAKLVAQRARSGALLSPVALREWLEIPSTVRQLDALAAVLEATQSADWANSESARLVFRHLASDPAWSDHSHARQFIREWIARIAVDPAAHSAEEALVIFGAHGHPSAEEAIRDRLALPDPVGRNVGNLLKQMHIIWGSRKNQSEVVDEMLFVSRLFDTVGTKLAQPEALMPLARLRADADALGRSLRVIYGRPKSAIGDSLMEILAEVPRPRLSRSDELRRAEEVMAAVKSAPLFDAVEFLGDELKGGSDDSTLSDWAEAWARDPARNVASPEVSEALEKSLEREILRSSSLRGPILNSVVFDLGFSQPGIAERRPELFLATLGLASLDKKKTDFYLQRVPQAARPALVRGMRNALERELALPNPSPALVLGWFRLPESIEHPEVLAKVSESMGAGRLKLDGKNWKVRNDLVAWLKRSLPSGEEWHASEAGVRSFHEIMGLTGFLGLTELSVFSRVSPAAWRELDGLFASAPWLADLTAWFRDRVHTEYQCRTLPSQYSGILFYVLDRASVHPRFVPLAREIALAMAKMESGWQWSPFFSAEMGERRSQLVAALARVASGMGSDEALVMARLREELPEYAPSRKEGNGEEIKAWEQARKVLVPTAPDPAACLEKALRGS